jgi:general secretion pathway protein F
MAVYKFKGVDSSGKNIKGVRDADSVRTLQNMLRKEGIFPTDIEEDKAQKVKVEGEINIGLFTKGVSTQELAVLTRQLATLLKAGVTLVESLAALVDQSDNPTLKLVLVQVKQRVNEGSSLADAMAKHPKVFPDLYSNMINAGESSGALDVVLNRLADFTEGQARLRSKVIGALTYPVIMIFIGLAILTVLMIVIIPKISKIFEDCKKELPLPTKVLMGMSEFMGNYWWLMLILTVLFFVGLAQYIKTEKGRTRWDRMRLELPIVGHIVRMLSVARFSRTLSTLLHSGVPLLSAMGIVRNIVNNMILAKVIDEAKVSIKEGESIAAPLKRSGEFPPMVIHMIAVGERTGQLESMLNNVADNYQEQAETRINALTSLLEPLMIVFMGVAVGFMVFAILLPILQLNEFGGG